MNAVRRTDGEISTCDRIDTSRGQRTHATQVGDGGNDNTQPNARILLTFHPFTIDRNSHLLTIASLRVISSLRFVLDRTRGNHLFAYTCFHTYNLIHVSVIVIAHEYR